MRYALVVALVATLVSVGYWYGARPQAPITAQIATSTQDTALDSTPLTDVPKDPAPPLGPTYTNKKFRFSLQMPADFKVTELPPDEGGASTVLLQSQNGEGVQILITPSKDSPNTLSADDVRASIPDLRIGDVQAVEIGPDNQGVAFLSDNDAFAGRSREVWFYFRGNLYQISTYARLDPLLKSMFGTWKFF